MTDKKLRKLSRAALIELLIEQEEENDYLTKELEELERQLNNREINIQNAGSIAEAALVLNDVFLAAENAATQYVDNLARLNAKCDKILADAKREAAQIIRQAQFLVPQPSPVEALVEAPKLTDEPEPADEQIQSEIKQELPLRPKNPVELSFDEVFEQLRRHNK